MPTSTIEQEIAAALEADTGDPTEPTAVRVLCDVFAWTTPAPKGSKARVIHHHARAGDVVEVERAHALRGVVLGAVDLVDGASSAEPSSSSVDLAALEDAAALGKVPAADVLAYIAQHGAESDEAAAVADLEADRGAKARKSVLKAAGWTADEVAAATTPAG